MQSKIKMIIQFLINGLIAGLLYALLAMAFSLTYNTTKVFSMAYAGVIVFACFIQYFFLNIMLFPIIVAILITIILTSILNTIIEKFLYQKLENRGNSLNSILVASIGLFIVLTNALAMFFGNGNKTFFQEFQNSLQFGNIIITKVQGLQLLISVIIISALFIVLNKTNLGLKIKAISFDNLLFQIFGNNATKLRLILYFVSGGIAAIVSLLIGYDVGFNPYFGMALLLNALVAMIIGGFGSFKGALFGGIILGIIQSLSVYFFDTKWETAISFLILILILIFRPQGLYGTKQRWV